MASPVGSLVVRIASDARGLVSGTRRAQSSLRGMDGRARQTARRVTMLKAAIAGLGSAIAVNMVRKGLQAIDEQAKLARQLDTTIGAVRGLQLAAEEAGVSKDVMSRAAERLNARLGEAQRGTGSAADALDRLGLSARELGEMDIDDRFATIADRVKTLGLSSSQTADELRQLGIRQGELVAFMRDGGDAIRDASDVIEQFGLNISDVDAAQIERANDAMSRIGLVTEGVRAQMAIELAPVLEDVANNFFDAASEADGWGREARAATEIAVRGIANVLDALGHVIGFVENNPMVAQMGVVGYALFGRRGLAIGAAAGAAFDLVDSSMERAGDRLGQVNSQLETFNDEIQEAREEADDGGVFAAGAEQRLQTLERARDLLQEERRELIENQAETEGLTGSFRDLEEQLSAIEQQSDDTGESISNVAHDIADMLRSSLDGGDRPAFMDLPDATDFEGMLDAQTEYEARSQGSAADHHEKRLDQLREFLRDEKESEIHAHEERLQQLRTFLDQGLITEREYKEMKEALEEGHLERMAELRDQARAEEEDKEKAWAGRRLAQHKNLISAIEQVTGQGWAAAGDLMTSELEGMASALSTQSKSMFRIAQAAGIANAIISTHRGITKALELGWPQGPIAAAAIAARGFASVAAIRSQSFSGGGGGGGTASGGGGTAQAQQQQTPLEVRATFQGDFFTAGQVQQGVSDLFEQLEGEAQRRGLNLTVVA